MTDLFDSDPSRRDPARLKSDVQTDADLLGSDHVMNWFIYSITILHDSSWEALNQPSNDINILSSTVNKQTENGLT
jgi:hypothetical protein